jgi:hypothetical protein
MRYILHWIKHSYGYQKMLSNVMNASVLEVTYYKTVETSKVKNPLLTTPLFMCAITPSLVLEDSISFLMMSLVS